MELNNFKNSFPIVKLDDSCWLHLSTILGQMSNKILTNEKFNLEIRDIMFFLFQTSLYYDINLQQAWYKWKRKASNKVYSST